MDAECSHFRKARRTLEFGQMSGFPRGLRRVESSRELGMHFRGVLLTSCASRYLTYGDVKVKSKSQTSERCRAGLQQPALIFPGGLKRCVVRQFEESAYEMFHVDSPLDPQFGGTSPLKHEIVLLGSGIPQSARSLHLDSPNTAKTSTGDVESAYSLLIEPPKLFFIPCQNMGHICILNNFKFQIKIVSLWPEKISPGR